MFIKCPWCYIVLLTIAGCPQAETWYPWQRMFASFNWNENADVSGLNSIRATYQGLDSYNERYDDIRKIGNEFMDQHFYLCYNKDGTKTYFKKLDPRQFKNKRYWVVSANSGFVASMELC